MTTATASLEQLLEIDGVVAAGEFAPDGSLVDFKGKMDMSPELAQMSAQFCSSVTGLFNTLSGAFTQMSGMSWSPQHGWAFAGGDYSVCVGGNRGVFVEAAKADYNELFAALIGSRS